MNMREDWIRKDVFEKVSLVKGLIHSTITGLQKTSDDGLKLMICHLAHFHCNNRKTITENEAIIYDTLIRNDINPSTAYKWFCLTMLPADFRHKMKSGRITQKQALRQAAGRKRDREIRMSLEIMQMVRESIRKI